MASLRNDLQLVLIEQRQEDRPTLGVVAQIGGLLHLGGVNARAARVEIDRVKRRALPARDHVTTAASPDDAIELLGEFRRLGRFAIGADAEHLSRGPGDREKIPPIDQESVGLGEIGSLVDGRNLAEKIDLVDRIGPGGGEPGAEAGVRDVDSAIGRGR